MFAINSIGPLLTIQALLPNVLKSTSSHPKIGIMTSRVGSIGDNSSGGMYAYRASKAAANQISKNLAVEPVLKERGVVVMALHPGFVRSGLIRSFDCAADSCANAVIQATAVLVRDGRVVHNVPAIVSLAHARSPDFWKLLLSPFWAKN